MDQQWLGSSYTYLASMVLIVCGVVSQPHTRTIIFRGCKRISRCQWEERDAGNEVGTVDTCGGEEGGRQGGRCGISSTLENPQFLWSSGSSPSKDHLCIFCKNAFKKASV